MKRLLDKRNLLAVGLFIACTGISVAAWFVSFGIAFAHSLGATLGGSSNSSSGSNATFIFCLFLPIVLFPTCAYEFRKALGTSRAVLLGISLIALPFIFVLVFEIITYWDNYRPKNGTQMRVIEHLSYSGNEGDVKNFSTYEQGQLVRSITICPNGLYRYIGEFENNKRVGTHLEFPACMQGNDITLTTYGGDGKPVETLQLSQWFSVSGPYRWISRSFVENGADGKVDRSANYRWREDTGTYYQASESAQYPSGHKPRFVYREFDETGKLVSEHSDD